MQKHIFCYFKNGKKSTFAPEKSLKPPKMHFFAWKIRIFWLKLQFFHLSAQCADDDDDKDDVLIIEQLDQLVIEATKTCYDDYLDHVQVK